MNWIKLEIGTLPEGEILCANFAKGTYGYREKIIGYAFDNDDTISCEGNELLENCTHYIDLNKYDIM